MVWNSVCRLQEFHELKRMRNCVSPFSPAMLGSSIAAFTFQHSYMLGDVSDSMHCDKKFEYETIVFGDIPKVPFYAECVLEVCCTALNMGRSHYRAPVTMHSNVAHALLTTTPRISLIAILAQMQTAAQHTVFAIGSSTCFSQGHPVSAFCGNVQESYIKDARADLCFYHCLVVGIQVS